MTQTRVGFLLLMGVAANVLTLLLAVFITIRIQENAERQQCDLIRAQLTAYHETPPSTPTGRSLSGAWQNLSDRYECERTGR